MNLEAVRDWYLTQAENPDNSWQDRDWWQRLADELTIRLETANPTDDALF